MSDCVVCGQSCVGGTFLPVVSRNGLLSPPESASIEATVLVRRIRFCERCLPDGKIEVKVYVPGTDRGSIWENLEQCTTIYRPLCWMEPEYDKPPGIDKQFRLANVALGAAILGGSVDDMMKAIQRLEGLKLAVELSKVGVHQIRAGSPN